MDSTWLWVIPISGILALAFVIYLVRDVLSRDEGTADMKAVADTIYEGAIAFIKRQYATIGVLAIVGTLVIGGIVATERVTETPVSGLNLGLMDGCRVPRRRRAQCPERHHRHVCGGPLECPRCQRSAYRCRAGAQCGAARRRGQRLSCRRLVTYWCGDHVRPV